MTNPTIAKGRQPRGPVPARNSKLPAGLYGSRAAIFHLLRRNVASEAAAAPRSSTVSARVQAFPVGVREPDASPGARDPRWQGLFQEDQFEFLSIEARGTLLRSVDRRIAS